MNVKTVIFDLDGTLLNTLGDLTDAVNAAIVPRGLAPATLEDVRQRIGNGIRRLITLSLPDQTSDQTIDDCLAVFRAHYNAHMMCRTHPYDRIVEVLQALHDAGIQIAVLSNKYDPAAKALTAHYFPGLIDQTFGERPNVPRKPDPTSCHELMEILGADPETTVYIGDSGVDMNTAKNAGLTSIGVTWGFRSREVLLENGACMLADHPQALLPLLLGGDRKALRQAFTSRGFHFSYFEKSEQAVEYLMQTCAGKTVGFGGSMTLKEIGAFDALSQTAEVHWHWNDEPPKMDAEIYITSANGLAETGEVVNIDGLCNRVAASLWGPESCYVVCGINKLAPSLSAAIDRARTIAAPRNAQRLHKDTPCTYDGKCHDCRSTDRICRAMTILMAPPSGIHHYEIVLIGENLGF